MTRPLPDGLYEHIVSGALARDLGSLEPKRTATTEPLDTADSQIALAQYLAREVERVLAAVPHAKRPLMQIQIVNRLLESLRLLGNEYGLRAAADRALPVSEFAVEPPGHELRSIHRVVPFERPATPLGSSTLLTRNRAEPNLGGELAREIASSDRIDVVVAFITVGGFRVVRDALERFARRTGDGVRLRILTTVFTQTTELDAIQALASLPGASVKVSYDTRRTRLHAKAWLFQRDTGLHSAYVGSANLTSTALGSGQEWMVKVCAADLPHVIEKFRGTFEGLWNDPEFEPFDASSLESRKRLQTALAARETIDQAHFFSLHPFPFQEEILDRLAAERSLHGRSRNLVVAATGTGKTVVAAFDYRRQVPASGIMPRLLFLAHRKELLEQARDTYRHALHDGAFGELLLGGEEPTRWEHVFATIQSAASRDVLGRLGPKHFEYVVVDECHHAPADSYRQLIPKLEPKILLGLTATPERSDGKSLLPDFDGHVAAELRIWHALDRQLLVPFEYYGISDATDLTRVRWTRSGYDLGELGSLYTGNDARVDLIVRQLHRFVSNVRGIRALAFCASVEHARYMAKALTERGLPAIAVHGDSDDVDRAGAPRQLRERNVNVICTCDLYNEGVDLPYVDTLLFLRPTASATLFIQQLGRGLRHSKDKPTCLVLDFIGQHRADFRFDTTLAALTGIPRARLLKATEQGFPLLPSGCTLQLDAVARAQVLESLKTHLTRRSRIVEEVKELAAESGGSLSLTGYLEATGRELAEVYTDDGGWTTLRRAAGLLPANDPEQDDLSRRLGWLLHVDEPHRTQSWVRAVQAPTLAVSDVGDAARLVMLGFQMNHRGVVRSAPEVVATLAKHAPIRDELIELAQVLDANIALPTDAYPVPEWPLALHRHYARREIAAAVGYVHPGKKGGVPQGGILKLDRQREILLVTLDKSDRSFSPSTRYRDYAIAPNLFHWETQSVASVHRPSGKRYVESPGNGWTFYLFVRTDPEAAYAFCGAAVYQSHEGDRPIAITWRLEVALPAGLYSRFATLMQG